MGRGKVEDGALLLVAKNDRTLRIEVGYGLEGALNDAVSKRIICDLITPRFQRGDVYGGIDVGTNAMVNVVLMLGLAGLLGSVFGRRLLTTRYTGFGGGGSNDGGGFSGGGGGRVHRGQRPYRAAPPLSNF